ncbi:MAG: hypothetical protein Q9199_000346 [Rusavskia elegans]
MADFYVASWLEQLDSLSASEISLPGSFPKNPPSKDSVIEDFVHEDSIAEESLARFERCIRLEHVHGRPSYPLAREIMEKVESPWIGHRTRELCVPLKFTGKVLASIVREVYDLVKYKDVFFAGKSMKIDELTPTIEEQERSYIDKAGRIMFYSQKIGLFRGYNMILQPEYAFYAKTRLLRYSVSMPDVRGQPPSQSKPTRRSRSTSPSRQLKPAPLTFQAMDDFLEMERKVCPQPTSCSPPLMLMASNVETQRAESFYGEHEDGAYGEAEDEGQDEEEEVVLDDHLFLNYADWS